jgi:hypothetical protein
MRCTRVGGLLALVVSIGPAAAAGNPEVEALKKEVSYVRKQESAVVKAIKTRYHAAYNHTHRTDEELSRERAILAKEETALVSYAATKADKDDIRAKYELLREALRGDIKLERKVTDKLHEQESLIVKQVQAIYRAHVKQLEAQIKMLEQAAKRSHPPKRK